MFLSRKPWSGKTTLAKHLCSSAATGGLWKARPVIRNETGVVREESWGYCKIEPYYYTIDCLKTLKRLIDEFILEVLEELAEKRHNNRTRLCLF